MPSTSPTGSSVEVITIDDPSMLENATKNGVIARVVHDLVNGIKYLIFVVCVDRIGCGETSHEEMTSSKTSTMRFARSLSRPFLAA